MYKLLKKTFSNDYINSIHSKYYKNNERNVNQGITKKECLAYRLLYTGKHVTKEYIAKKISFNQNTSNTRQAYDKQLKKYNLKFFNYLHNDIINNYSKLVNSSNTDKIIKNNIKSMDLDIDTKLLDKYEFILVDGSCGNKYVNHKLVTENCLYLYNLNDNVNIDTKICKKTKNNKGKKVTKTKTNKKRKKYNDSNKNSEIQTFIEYVYQNHIKLKKLYANKQIVFICDRGYHSSQLFETLNNYGFKYIIRLRENNIFARNDVKDEHINKIKQYSKITKYTIPIIIDYYDNILKRKNKVKYYEDYFLISNINDINDDNKEKLYNARWIIEIFFKFNKKNTKLALFKEKNTNDNEINRICISIINIVIKMLIHIYIKNIVLKNKKTSDSISLIKSLKYINYSLLIQGLYNDILIKLVCGNVKTTELNTFLKCFIMTCKNKSGRKFPRISLTPFSKWYVKKYHKSYNWSKIINAIKTNTLEELNKNLKSKATKIKDKIIFNFTDD
jgi:hypothetical protein